MLNKNLLRELYYLSKSSFWYGIFMGLINWVQRAKYLNIFPLNMILFNPYDFWHPTDNLLHAHMFYLKKINYNLVWMRVLWQTFPGYLMTNPFYSNEQFYFK